MNEEVVKLQYLVDDLIRVAKSNEKKQQHFSDKELKIIKLGSLHSLISEVTIKHEIDFNLSHAILFLDEQAEELVTTIIGVENKEISTLENHLKFIPGKVIAELFKSSRKPHLGVYDDLLHGQFFGSLEIKPSSVGLLPLERRGKLFGVLALGSSIENQFSNHMGTQFLQHYAAVLEVCLDNAFLISSVRDISFKDPLTGLWNRRFFNETIPKEILNKSEFDLMSVLIVDIDNFKPINDNYGHDVGDVVIKELAMLLKKEFDSIGNVCRWGGEEFLCWIHHTSQLNLIGLLNDFISKVKSHSFNTDVTSLSITVSIGLNTVNKAGMSDSDNWLDKIIKTADDNLYEAKNTGKNKVISTITTT